MKYLELLLLIMMLNISIELVNEIKLMPLEIIDTDSYNATIALIGMEDINNSEIKDPDSLTSRIKLLFSDTYFSQNSLDSGERVTAGSDTDYVKGMFLFTKAFAGGVLYFEGTLEAFHVPKSAYPFFIIPMYFMYSLAIIHLISGRNLEGR